MNEELNDNTEHDNEHHEIVKVDEAVVQNSFDKVMEVNEVKIDFLDFVDFDTKYSIKELTELYNKVHKTTLSTISVGKLSYIRQHFEKKRETNPMTHKQEYMYKLK